ncbi:NYN domain-containing protein [Anaerotardibacter muris]|uniref:NYN domain-containing protein n=1 Tax=Anaerotardibacter muris TaxID=2941505 RepID=UPI00203A9754|nr:NYN domain-containing protein [Anaerotardibacter muris]
MRKDMKVAVLIDAENISSKYAHTILQEASSLGNVIYKRIYGNWTSTQLGPWKKQLLDHAIQPIQQYSNTAGKNSSDSALIIDAMDLLYQGKLDAFCIVSSDSDFTRLASRLRESEMYVLGIGEQKTPRSFISACNKFVYLDVVYAEQERKDQKRKRKSDENKDREKAASAAKEETTPKTSTKQASKDRVAEAKHAKAAPEKTTSAEVEEFDDKHAYSDGTDIVEVTDALINILEEYSDDEGWMAASNLASLLSRRLNDFDTRNFGFKKFVPFVQSLKIFEDRSVAPSDDPNARAIFFRLIED